MADNSDIKININGDTLLLSPSLDYGILHDSNTGKKYVVLPILYDPDDKSFLLPYGYSFNASDLDSYPDDAADSLKVSLRNVISVLKINNLL